MTPPSAPRRRVRVVEQQPQAFHQGAHDDGENESDDDMEPPAVQRRLDLNHVTWQTVLHTPDVADAHPIMADPRRTQEQVETLVHHLWQSSFHILRQMTLFQQAHHAAQDLLATTQREHEALAAQLRDTQQQHAAFMDDARARQAEAQAKVRAVQDAEEQVLVLVQEMKDGLHAELAQRDAALAQRDAELHRRDAQLAQARDNLLYEFRAQPDVLARLDAALRGAGLVME